MATTSVAQVTSISAEKTWKGLVLRSTRSTVSVMKTTPACSAWALRIV